MTIMMKTIIVFLILSILQSCAIQKKSAYNEFVIAKEYSELLTSEITLISKDSEKLNCNQSNLIGVRLNGKINSDLILNGIGCVISGTKEKGLFSIKFLCNENNKNHELTITLKEENQERIVVAKFDLNKIL